MWLFIVACVNSLSERRATGRELVLLYDAAKKRVSNLFSNDQNESISIDMSVFFICCYKCNSISLCTVKKTSWEAEFLKSYIF